MAEVEDTPQTYEAVASQFKEIAENKVKWIPKFDEIEKSLVHFDESKQQDINSTCRRIYDSEDDDDWAAFFGDALDELKTSEGEKIPSNLSDTSTHDVDSDSSTSFMAENDPSKNYCIYVESSSEDAEQKINGRGINHLVIRMDELADQINESKKRQKKILKKLDYIIQYLDKHGSTSALC